MIAAFTRVATKSGGGVGGVADAASPRFHRSGDASTRVTRCGMNSGERFIQRAVGGERHGRRRAARQSCGQPGHPKHRRGRRQNRWAPFGQTPGQRQGGGGGVTFGQINLTDGRIQRRAQRPAAHRRHQIDGVARLNQGVGQRHNRAAVRPVGQIGGEQGDAGAGRRHGRGSTIIGETERSGRPKRRAPGRAPPDAAFSSRN